MRIERKELFDAFEEFANRASGVVIGSPGVGKTFLLSQFNSSNPKGKLYLPIDKLGAESENDLKNILEIDGSFVDYLKKFERDDNFPNILLIDAFDAARSDRARKFYLRLIKRVLQDLVESWKVVVSVRTYDAIKSQELQDLFPKRYDLVQSSKFVNNEAHCHHFYVPELSDKEREGAVNSIPNLHEIVKSASSEFNELLRIPFNLWLAEKILSVDVDKKEFSSVHSEIQLLDLFWRYRVFNDPTGDEKNLLLSKIARKMVHERNLSVRADTVFANGIPEVRGDLLKAEVIAYTPNEQRVVFKHNILFDYAVSILLIEDDLDEFVKFLNEDPSRPLFLRPSLVFFFTRTWFKKRELFWHIFWGILTDTQLSIRLFARLLPPTVLIKEANDIRDLVPLIKSLQGDPEVGRIALQRVLQSYRIFQPAEISIWLVFLKEASENLSHEFGWDLVVIAEQISQHTAGTAVEELCGSIARNVFKWVWSNRLGVAGDWYDNIGAVKAAPLVARTFGTNPAESKALLIGVLDLLNEPNFPITYFFRLAEYIDSIWNYDPEFVADFYLRIYTHHEDSEQKTRMGTPVVPMTSTRRQDFEMCRFILARKFPEFIKAKPISAVRLVLQIVGFLIVQEHVLKYRQREEEIEKQIELFSFRAGNAKFLEDYSYFWDAGPRDDFIELADHLFGFINEVVSSKEKQELLDPILDEFRDHAMCAFFWKRLLDSGTLHPEILAVYLFELFLAVPVLRSRDVTRELQKFIEEAFAYYSPVQRLAIETRILEVAEADPNGQWKNQMVARIPTDLLQLKENKKLKKEMEESQKTPPITPPINYQITSSEYTEEMWFEDEGIDISKDENHALLSATAPLNSFSSKWQNEIPEINDLREIFSKAEEAFNLAEEATHADDRVLETIWTRIGECARAMCRGIKDAQSEEFRFCKKVLLICSIHPSPLPNPEYDSKYSSAGWSPAPRTEAAQGLPWLAMRSADNEIIQAIWRLVEDPKPSVRFLVVSELFRLIESDSDEFWKLAQHVAENEQNQVVQEALFRILGFVALRDIGKTTAILESFFKKRWENLEGLQIWSTAIPLITGLAFAKENPWAINTLNAFLEHPVESVRPLHAAVFEALGFVTPEILTNVGNRPIGERAIKWISEAIDAVSKAILEILNINPEDRSDDLEHKLYAEYKVIDRVVLKLYFAAKINDPLGIQHEGGPITDEQRKQYFEVIKPLLERILDFARHPEHGFLFAPTAYHFMQLLNGVLKYEPKTVIHMAATVARSSAGSGFTIDSMAIGQMVKMVELVLADYRYEVRANDALEDLLTLLDTFAETGGSVDALRLVWRLDEIYR